MARQSTGHLTQAGMQRAGVSAMVIASDVVTGHG